MAESGKSRVENESYSIKYTWKIKNFSTIDSEKLYSDVFAVGDHKWRILIFPKGNKENGNLSIYLDVADLEKLPNGWTRRVEFTLSVISEVDEHSVEKRTDHTFKASKRDWGFTSFMALDELHKLDRRFLVNDTCSVKAEVWFNEEKDKEELNTEDKVDIKLEKSLSSFSNIDTLFTDIQNCLQEKTTVSNFFSDDDVAEARTILKKKLNMDVTSFIRSGRSHELKTALSLLLTAEEIPISKISEMRKFVANFDQRCEKYEAAKLCLSEAREKEDLLGETKSTLKQLSSRFAPLRSQREITDREIAMQEKLLAESKAKRARLRKRLDELAEQATTSKKALVRAEEDVKMCAMKKEEADKTISEFHITWESLKDLLSVGN